MKKSVVSFLYLLLHPVRAVAIFKLYQFLKGKYRFTIIFSQAYREAFYKKNAKKKKQNVENSNKRKNLDEQQVIINIHDGLLHSGGLTDRLKGICTLYMYAKKNNFKLKIYFVAPFNLEKYLLPNLYDWSVEESFISYNLNETAIYTWENEKLAVYFFQTNQDKKQLHINCNSGEYSKHYSELFHELFKPSPFLYTKIDFHIKNLGGEGKFISISLRFQNLLGEFEEGNSAALNSENRELLIESCLSAINDIKIRFSSTEKILLTSDSNVFREIAAKTFGYIYTYILPEETGHIDYAKSGNAKELTAFLDMFLISKAEKVFQLRTSEMYNSDFPNRAAKINNKPYEILLIK